MTFFAALLKGRLLPPAMLRAMKSCACRGIRTGWGSYPHGGQH